MEVKELKTLVKLVKGKKPKSLSETKTKTHSEPYLLAKVIRGSEKPKFGKEDEMVIVSSSDLVIISDGDAGEVFQGLNGGLASTMSKIEPLENINLKYLKYFLISNRKLFSDTRTGAAIPHLNKDVFFNLQIPVPSLQEQEKIVERLDIIFGKIDNDITNYKKRLIEIGNLFNSNLHSTFVNTEDRHREFFLEGCIKHQRGLTFKKSDVVDYSDLKILRANNIDYEKYSFVNKDFLYLNPKIQIEDKYFTEKNDIIVCMSTGSRKHLGKVAIIEENIKYVVGGFLGKITANIEVLDPKYLYYFLINPKVKKIIYDSVISMTINNLRIDILNKLLIPVPNIKEQKKIVENLDKFFDNMTNLTQNYEKIITNFNDLKKLILYKEFSYE